jgi:hypothetical protein
MTRHRELIGLTVRRLKPASRRIHPDNLTREEAVERPTPKKKGIYPWRSNNH